MGSALPPLRGQAALVCLQGADLAFGIEGRASRVECYQVAGCLVTMGDISPIPPRKIFANIHCLKYGNRIIMEASK